MSCQRLTKALWVYIACQAVYLQDMQDKGISAVV